MGHWYLPYGFGGKLPLIDGSATGRDIASWRQRFQAVAHWLRV